MDSINLWINDQKVEATADQTILEVADGFGCFIPRLCNHPALKPSGSCRLCAVEVEGYRGLPAACSTPVQPGMRVRTDSPKVLDFRREMLRLILQEHPRECLGCPRNGTCELQRLVDVVGIDFPYAPPDSKKTPGLPAGSYFERDPRLCVRCGRCVRACHEVRGAGVLVFRDSHGRQEVGTPLGRSLEEANCQFCGACVDVCPVAALREPLKAYAGEPRDRMAETCESLTKIVMDLYRKELPRSWQKSVCPLCSALCPMSFETTESNEIVQARPTPADNGSRGQACVQGRFLLKDHLQGAERLRKPLRLENGAYREIAWDDALDELAGRLSKVGPWETALVTDARVTTEELFVLQKFARTALRSNLVGSLTPPGHSAFQEILAKSQLPGDPRGCLSDLSQAGVAIAIGVNPPATHPIGGTLLRRVSLSGTRLIVANPCAIGICRFADVALNYTPGTELVLVSGLIRLLLDEGRVDASLASGQRAYLKKLRADLDACDPETVGAITGVHPEKLLETACLFGGEKPVSILYGPGLLASANGQGALEAMMVLLYLTGSIGKVGGGLVPLYGDANLLGASALDMTSQLFEMAPSGGNRGASGPEHLGEILASGQIKALYVAMESSNSGAFEMLQPYLDKLDCVVLHDTVAPTLASGGPMPHLVLPMASAVEKGGTFIGTAGQPLEIPQLPTTVSEGRSALWVVQELARRMKQGAFTGRDEAAMIQEIRREISERTVLVLRKERVVSGCACCGAASVVKSPQCQAGPPDWKPPVLKPVEHQAEREHSLRVVAKDSLEPHFMGPLLAPEVKRVFYPDGDIEMNPGDGFRSGFRPGDAVRVTTDRASWEGRLAFNGLVPEGVIALPVTQRELSENLGDAMEIIAVRIEKAETAASGESE